jgi:DNA polymerase-3 subunit epsilon
MEALALESMAEALEASGAYRVLRRIAAASSDAPRLVPRPGARLAVFLDLETTGLDPRGAEVIELAMTPFLYDQEGRVLTVGASFQAFNEPSAPIPEEVTAITGITDDMVRGARIDPGAVAGFLADAALVIAHNAGFDRVFAEKLDPVFAQKPWACSMSQIDWRAEGLDGRKLDYLAFKSGLFYDGHRAENDCLAAIELLSRPLPRSGRPALLALLERARRPTVQIFAEGAPFDLKEVLKARGYRWNGEANGRPRAWWTEADEGDLETEIAFLEAEIYHRPSEALVRRVSAWERFSDRG